VKVVFEKQTELDTFGRPSQTDVLALLRIKSGNAILGIEAKVDETFGPLVIEWDNGSPGKGQRLRAECQRAMRSGKSAGICVFAASGFSASIRINRRDSGVTH
jgi:hypothetical protein